jgi:hypothetical protein
MNANRIFGALTIILSLMLLAVAIALAQPAPIPFRQELYTLNSGVHVGLADKSIMAFREVVRAPEAPWLQLHFSDYNLGQRSYITLTSLQDESQQRLDEKSLTRYLGSSAYFNGDAVEVKLYVAPGEKGIFFRLSEIIVGEWAGQPKSLCDGDNRVSSTDPRVGRIMPIGCTGWITSNGAHLTAGHCTAGALMWWLQFNIPPSLADGTVQHPPPEDQYWIVQGSIVWFDDGNGQIGNDWAVFACEPDDSTDLLPVHAQGAFYRMSRDNNPSNVRVTGVGQDNTPPGSTGGLNSDSQTLQTDSGSYLGETVEGPSDVRIEYTVDTEPGSSGSPVIILGTTLTVGIHTDGGCSPPSEGNEGTGFEHDNLENAIRTFPGPNATYVDKDHPVTLEDGTVFRPYNTVAEGITAVTSGGILSIVTGSYDETMTISKAMTLVAPVGMVTIGQ